VQVNLGELATAGGRSVLAAKLPHP
jgi:hypothetical protein